MAQREFMIFFEDMSRSVVKADNILSALQGISSVEKVIRVSRYEKDKAVISNRIIDEEFDDQDDFRPPANQ